MKSLLRVSGLHNVAMTRDLLPVGDKQGDERCEDRGKVLVEHGDAMDNI